MKTLLKSIGVILLLIGVAVLAVPFFNGTRTNMTLGLGLLLVILGFFAHIFLNKRFE
jgi:uncharacterized membrane protein HdeD (DUF308 family)